MEFRKKSKTLYDSRGDDTSAAVACAAVAATAAAAAARGRSYINHRAKSSTEPDCCCWCIRNYDPTYARKAPSEQELFFIGKKLYLTVLSFKLFCLILFYVCLYFKRQRFRTVKMFGFNGNKKLISGNPRLTKHICRKASLTSRSLFFWLSGCRGKQVRKSHLIFGVADLWAPTRTAVGQLPIGACCVDVIINS